MYWYSPLFAIPLGDSKQMTNKRLARFKNNIEFQNTFSRLVTDAMYRYHIEGLPDTCSERVVLQSLIWYGSVSFFEKDNALLALPGIPTEDFNVYGEPKFGFVFGCNGFNERVRYYVPGADDTSFLLKGVSGQKGENAYHAVFVRENEICYPFLNQIIKFAESIADSYRTLEVCKANIKQPYLIACDQRIVNSVKEFFKHRDDNVEYIVDTGVFPADKISLLPFETNESNLKNCTDLIEWYENKFAELCGKYSNDNPDKKERLLVDEVNANNETTHTALDKCIDVINEGLDNVNKVFGTSIKCVSNIEEESNGEYDLRGGSDGEPGSVRGNDV